MAVMALLALLIFGTFAVVGGLLVYFVVQKTSSSNGDVPPRGFPQDQQQDNGRV